MRFITFAAIVLATSFGAVADDARPALPNEDTAVVIWEAPPAAPVPATAPAAGAHGVDTAVARPGSGGEALTGAVDDLSWLAGRWQFRRQRPGGPAGEATDRGRLVARPGPGGHSLIIETMVLDGPGAGSSLVEVIVPSPRGRGFEIHTFASDTPFPTVAPAWLDGGVLGWERTTDTGGKRITTAVRIENVAGERLTRTAESIVEGERGGTLEVTSLVRR